MTEKSEFNNSITVNGQYIKDISFENPKAPYSFINNKNFNINVSVDIGAHSVEGDTHEVVLSILVKAQDEDKMQFLVDLKYAGLFTVDKAHENMEYILFVKCPEIIFPYARRIISDITRDGGYLPVYISPIDFHSLYLKNKDKN